MEMQIIKLLNEFEKEKTKQDVIFWDYYQNWFHYLENGQTYSELLMISKKYEFIKWLVENDKIDRDIMEGEKFYYYLEKSENMHWDKNFSRCERLLMLLSISDTPIEDLLLYLK